MTQSFRDQTYTSQMPERKAEQSGFWHMALPSAKLEPNKSVGILVQDEPIVLYRNKALLPVALEDRCPHRWARLSGGRVDGDNIVCPYHGFKFCPRGRLVVESEKSDSPGTGTARVFPVIERNSQIWIWLGDGCPNSETI